MDIVKYRKNKELEISNDDFDIEKLEKDARKGTGVDGLAGEKQLCHLSLCHISVLTQITESWEIHKNRPTNL